MARAVVSQSQESGIQRQDEPKDFAGGYLRPSGQVLPTDLRGPNYPRSFKLAHKPKRRTEASMWMLCIQGKVQKKGCGCDLITAHLFCTFGITSKQKRSKPKMTEAMRASGEGEFLGIWTSEVRRGI